jgi:hypothetical protein
MSRTCIAVKLAITLSTMDRDTLTCDTERMAVIQPDEEFVREANAFKRASEALEARRKSLAPKIAQQVAKGVQLARVGRECGYTPEHIRRIAREHGVEPAVDRKPPTGRKSTPDPEADHG